MPDTHVEPFQFHFGIKSVKEVMVDGIRGIKTIGQASKYNVVDSDGEYQVPGSFRDVADTWGRQLRPLVLFQHGLDPILGVAPIGWGTKWEHNDDGLLAECFIPENPNPPFTDNVEAKNKRYREIYQGIKNRLIRHYSVGGIFTRVGKALTRWSMSELTITMAGALGEDGSFVLGTKAIDSYMDSYLGEDMSPAYSSMMGGASALDPPQYSQTDIGHINRNTFTDVMNKAQQGNDRELHDHLLNKPPEYQGAHDAANCPICDARRTARGIKSEDFNPPEAAEAGDKAKNPDGDYLLVDKDGQHIRVRKNGTLDHGLMGEAYAALTSNFRGNPYKGPDKEGLLAKLRKLYSSEKMPWPGDSAAAGAGGVNGGKIATDNPIVKEAVDFIEQVGAAQKAGKVLSAATIKALKQAIALIESLLPKEGDTVSG